MGGIQEEAIKGMHAQENQPNQYQHQPNQPNQPNQFQQQRQQQSQPQSKPLYQQPLAPQQQQMQSQPLYPPQNHIQNQNPYMQSHNYSSKLPKLVKSEFRLPMSKRDPMYPKLKEQIEEHIEYSNLELDYHKLDFGREHLEAAAYYLRNIID